MFPPEKIKAMTLPHIEKAVGRSVSVKKVGLSFFPVFGLKLSGLEISNTEREGFSKEPFFTLEKFLIKVKVIPLFQKRLEIAAIILQGPTVLVEVDREGTFNYDDLAFMKKEEKPEEKKPEEEEKPKGPPALPIPMTMEQFKIVKGQIKYFDHKAGRYVTFGDVNQRVDFSIDKELKDIKSTGELVLSQISVRTGEIPKPLSNVSFTFNHDVGVNMVEGSAVINTVRLSLQKIFITMTGSVKNFNDKPSIDLSVNSDKILIADVIKEIPPELVPIVGKLKAEGFVQIALALKGTIDKEGIPDIKGQLSLGDGNISYEDLPKSISNIHANVHFTKNRLEIEKFGFKFGENPVMLRALVWDFKQPNIDGALKATFDLGDVKDFVELPQGMSLSGVIKSDITAKGQVDPANPDQLDVDGNIALTNLNIKTPEITKPVKINGTVNFTPKQIMNKLAITIGSSDINVSSNITDYQSLMMSDSTKKSPRPKINFNVVSALLNTSEFLQKKEEPVKKEAKAPKKSEPGPVMAAPLPGVDMNGKISCKRFVYENVEMTNFNTNLSSVNDVMKIATSANIYKGSMSNNLNLNAKDINNVKVANWFNVNNIEVNDFISNFNDLLSEDEPLFRDLKKMDNAISGRLTLDSDINCSGKTSDDMVKSLDGEINARINNGKINGGVITQSIGGATKGILKFGEPVIKNLAGGANILNFLNLGTMSFRNYKQKLILRDQYVIFDPSKLNSSSVGDWGIDGRVGFNGNLDINLANRLPKNVSSKILEVQNKLKDPATGLMKQGEKELGKYIGKEASKALGNIAKKELDKTMIESDNEGRVTALYKLGGTAGSPKITSAKFKTGRSSAPEAKEESPKQEIKKIVEKKVEEVKQEVKKVVEEKKEEVKKEVEQKKEEVKKEVEQKKQEVKKEVDKKKEDAKKDAKKKLKKLF
jgi:uncharacterized protein involved in outer membrane biogenesis